MNPRPAAASLVALVASAAACSSSTSPGDDRTPVTVSLGPPSTVPLLAASTNRIYTLRGIDPTSIAVEARSLSGAQRWRVTFPSCQDACFLAADGQDNLYLTTATNTVSLTGASGAVRWTAPIRGAVVAVGSNGRVYVGSRPFAVPQRVYSLDAATGDINWITTVLPSLDATGLLVDEFHSTIYAVGRGRVSVLNILNGAVQRTTAADCFGGSQGAIAADGSVYVSCDSDFSSRLIAYNPGGLVKWVTPLGTVNGTTAPVIDAAGTIYVANRGALSALRPDGALLWQLNGLFNNDVSPAVGSNNDVYIHAALTSGGTGSMLVVNNGAIVEDKGPMGCALAFLLTPTGRVYCGSNGGFAFFQGNNSDATGQWTQLGSDAQRGSRKP
jgi:outer membrane protein assembly factor BamB